MSEALRRLRLRPHEVVAVVFAVAGFVVLERMPLHYPRAALFLAHATSSAIIFAVALAISWVRFRRDRTLWRGEAIEIARSSAAFLVVFSTSFVLKSFIYVINRRVWDRELFALDRALHFGSSPTVFLVTLLDSPAVLRILDVYYSQLYFVIFLGVPAFLLARLSQRQRVRFTAAFIFMWIAGNVLYLALPSWGPVFTAPALVEKSLQSMPATMWVQRQLFDEISSLVRNPMAPRIAKFGGVAAFPSLHVAVVTLFALAMRRLVKSGFVVMLIAVALMQIGSVITGYHFMVDGYVGALLAAGSWWIAGFVAGRGDEERVPPAPAQKSAPAGTSSAAMLL